MDMGMGVGTKRLFFFNSVSGVAQLVLTGILIFASIPLFINNLGEVSYGVFCAISVIGNLGTLANLSLDASLIKYISEQGKCQDSDNDILATLIFLVLILVPLSLCIFIFKDFILLNVLNIPITHIKDAEILLCYLLIANFFLLVGRVFSAILDSLNKIYLTNLYMFIYSFLYWGGIICVTFLTRELANIGQSVFISALIWFFLVLFSALKSWGKINIRVKRSSLIVAAKKQIKYSSKIWGGSLLGFLYEPLTKILISKYIGVSYVGFYEIALKIKSNLLAIFSKLMYPIYPLIAQEQNFDKLRLFIQKISRLIFYAVSPIIIIFLICTEPIITLWIGGENTQIISISTIVLVCSGLLFSSTVFPIYIFLRLKNHPEKEMLIQGINVISNSLIIMTLYQYIGYNSIVLGNALSIFCSFLICIYFQKKYLNFYPFINLKEIGIYFVAFAFIFFVGKGTFYFLEDSSWFNIFLISSLCIVLTLIILWKEKVIAKEMFDFFNDNS